MSSTEQVLVPSADPVIAEQSVFRGDDVQVTLPGFVPAPEPLPHGTPVEGVYFDGYPQLIKEPDEGEQYGITIEKDISVELRDGIKLKTDVYRPDAEGRFPALLAWGFWGKDAQEAVAWNRDKPQPYYDSPFWDGTMEAGDYTYLVPRGFAHVIPDPRGLGDSEGGNISLFSTLNPDDIADVIRWIAAQPWCNGKVGMLGPSSYSWAQMNIAESNPPEELVALHPDELIYWPGSQFHGMFDTLGYHIQMGRHGNDSTAPRSNQPEPLAPPMTWALPEEIREAWMQEALEHPDIRYNTKWYSELKYPMKSPFAVDEILGMLHPAPMESHAENMTLPMYAGTPWTTRLYIWGTFHVWEHSSTPDENKKLIVYPPGFPPRPNIYYHDEIVRWYEYWLAGRDNGIMDEPPIKLFVMGVNKWRFENEWPLARTQWTNYYLQPEGGLAPERPRDDSASDVLIQPAPYEDPTVYCLRYSTGPLEEDLELCGPIGLHFDATIDTDDTNWMVDLVDVAPDGTRQLLSSGHLKARYRALDEEKSRPFEPIHPRAEGAPVPEGEKVRYDIAMMPTANVFQEGHAMELIIRNQDDILSRLGTWGVYMLPFMRTVRHELHLGEAHLVLPVIPKA